MQQEVKVNVLDIIQRTPDVKSIRVKRDGNLTFKAGQFMSFSLEKQVKDMTKWLSISSSPSDKNYLEVTKKITGSKFSEKLNALKIHDTVTIKYPFGNFVLKPDCNKIAFLSGGIGITPIMSMCRYIKDENTGTDVKLIYGNRSVVNIAFKKELDEIKNTVPNIEIAYILSCPEDEWHGLVGHIDANIIKDQIQDYEERTFYICGPPLMVTSLKAILSKELNMSSEKIVTENFTGY